MKGYGACHYVLKMAGPQEFQVLLQGLISTDNELRAQSEVCVVMVY